MPLPCAGVTCECGLTIVIRTLPAGESAVAILVPVVCLIFFVSVEALHIVRSFVFSDPCRVCSTRSFNVKVSAVAVIWVYVVEEKRVGASAQSCVARCIAVIVKISDDGWIAELTPNLKR